MYFLQLTQDDLQASDEKKKESVINLPQNCEIYFKFFFIKF